MNRLGYGRPGIANHSDAESRFTNDYAIGGFKPPFALGADFAAIDASTEFAAEIGQPANSEFELDLGVLPGDTSIGRKIKGRRPAAIRTSNQDFVGAEILEFLDALKAAVDPQGHE